MVFDQAHPVDGKGEQYERQQKFMRSWYTTAGYPLPANPRAALVCDDYCALAFNKKIDEAKDAYDMVITRGPVTPDEDEYTRKLNELVTRCSVISHMGWATVATGLAVDLLIDNSDDNRFSKLKQETALQILRTTSQDGDAEASQILYRWYKQAPAERMGRNACKRRYRQAAERQGCPFATLVRGRYYMTFGRKVAGRNNDERALLWLTRCLAGNNGALPRTKKDRVAKYIGQLVEMPTINPNAPTTQRARTLLARSRRAEAN